MLGDDIFVKWLLGSQSVWWPATVAAIEPHSSDAHKRNGEVLYHKMKDYASVLTPVVFSISSSHRFVSSVVSVGNERSESEPSSWMYTDEDSRHVGEQVSTAVVKSDKKKNLAKKSVASGGDSRGKDKADAIASVPHEVASERHKRSNRNTVKVSRCTVPTRATPARSSRRILRTRTGQARSTVAMNGESSSAVRTRATPARSAAVRGLPTPVRSAAAMKARDRVHKSRARSNPSTALHEASTSHHNSKQPRKKTSLLDQARNSISKKIRTKHMKKKAVTSKAIGMVSGDTDSSAGGSDGSEDDVDVGAKKVTKKDIATTSDSGVSEDDGQREGSAEDDGQREGSDDDSDFAPYGGIETQKGRTVGSSIQTGQHTQPSEDTDIGIRLRIIEQQLRNGTGRTDQPLSPSAMSVVVSLRWSLLRSLEKPLKVQQLSGLSTHGIARHDLSVSTFCDYFTFREIAALLAKEHGCSNENQSRTRVAFSPPFPTTQSGSTASNNMSILFSCLSDLTTFLRVRDDVDFERILSKELMSQTSSILRILGTFSIAEREADHQSVQNNAPDGSANFHPQSPGTESVSASSESCQTIRLFLGTSPIGPTDSLSSEPTLASSIDNTEEKTPPDITFETTVFEQDCKHYCLSQKCFRSPWTAKNVTSNMVINSEFHLDGTVPEEHLQKYFVLNWKRQVAPSSTKWTIDVQDVGNNTPGCLRLSIPIMYFNSSRNVQSVVTLLDKHIETFMKVRSEMHAFSSFK